MMRVLIAEFCDDCLFWHHPPVSQRGVDGPECPRMDGTDHMHGHHFGIISAAENRAANKAEPHDDWQDYQE